MFLVFPCDATCRASRVRVAGAPISAHPREWERATLGLAGRDEGRKTLGFESWALHKNN